jgi:hypothetical protein
MQSCNTLQIRDGKMASTCSTHIDMMHVKFLVQKAKRSYERNIDGDNGNMSFRGGEYRAG